MPELSYKLNCPDQSLNQAKYMLALIAAASGIRLYPNTDNPDIIYGDSQSAAALSIPWQPAESSSKWHTCTFDDLPLLLPQAFNGQLIDLQKRRFTFDLIATMGSYLEMKLTSHNNPTGNVSDISSGYRSEFDGYVRLFILALKKCGKLPADFRPESPWPAKEAFALGLSFDIDILKRKIPGSILMIAHALNRNKYRGGILGAWRGLLDSAGSQFSGKRNPYCQFDRYYSGNRQSTTFVFTGNRNDKRDPTYDLDSLSAELAPYLDKTELALHNGIGVWNRMDRLRVDKKTIANRFGKEVVGIRPHYLDCRLPDFWKNLAGFEYSSSLGSDSIPGFSAGVNIPLFGFTSPDWKRLPILELPIGLMDCALFSIVDKSSRYKFIDKLIAGCISNHGLLVADWHNASAYDIDYPGWFEAYEYLLYKAEQERAFIGSLGEINRIWRIHCESVFSY